MKCFVLLTVLVFASKIENDAESVAADSGKNIVGNAVEIPIIPIIVKIEEDEYAKKKTSSKYIGVSYSVSKSKWYATRWSKTEKKAFTNGSYKNEDTAAHASDTLARKLMTNGELHKLNFPDDSIEVYPKTKKSPKISTDYFGVFYNQKQRIWFAARWSRNEKRSFHNGTYKDIKTAARASDTLARKLIANGEQGHKLNFPDESTEVHREKSENLKYFGVYYNENMKRWIAVRWSKKEKKNFTNGTFKDEKKAAYASDNLARKLLDNGENGHQLNFPDDNIEVYPEKRKNSKYIGVYYDKKIKRWIVQRWSKREKNIFNSGQYKDEETAAHVSDTLARKLMCNGEQNLKLNFPEDNTEVFHEEKTKQSKYIGVSYHGKSKTWHSQRRSKSERKTVGNGTYKNEETAAHASDTLARKFMAKGEQNHKLNFPDNNSEVNKQQNTKRKRPSDFEYSETNDKSA